MSEFKWNDKLEALAQKHYTTEQLAELRARPFSAEDQARVSAAWAQIYADIDALGAHADPASEAALEIGRRAQALIGEFTRGDASLYKAAGALNRDAMADPSLSQQMPAQPHWAFMGKVFAELKKRG